MNSTHNTIIAITLGVCGGMSFSPSTLKAQTLFSDTLQSSSDASNWNINASGISAGTIDYKANFGFDYSTVGVPQDPYLTGSSTALQLKVNETSGLQAGVSVAPIGLNLTGNFTISFDMWLNYNSGGFTTGSTQVGAYGLSSTAATTAQWAGNGNGQLFGELTDNGSSTYFRGYTNGVSIGATPFVGSSQGFATTYHQGLFPSVSVPATETTINANQSGSTVAGTVGFRWLQISITSSNNIVSESINGNLIASENIIGLVGTNMFLSMYDFNGGSAGTTGIADENFVLFHNITINSLNPVPEPATYALAVLGASGLFLVRRRNRKM